MRAAHRTICRVIGILAVGLLPSPSRSDDAASTPPFRPYVDMATFMEHVLSPAADIIWSVNRVIIDARGEHDLAPKSDDDWERVVSGSAQLAEAMNALMIPQRIRDEAWTGYVTRLAAAAERAYTAAEAHDLKTIADVSDRLDGLCAACHRHYGVE